MPADRTVEHPTWPIRLTFEETRHIYRDSWGHRYQSVTSLTKQFVEPFDAVGISAMVAARDGKTPEQVRAEWKAKSEVACTVGTRIHEFAEYLFSGGSRGLRHQPVSERESGSQKAVASIYRDLIESGRYSVVGCEIIVFCPLRRVAGTIDLALRHVETGEVWLIDWKTNETIKREGYRGKCMQMPFDKVQDCDYEKYSLQLATYWQIMKTACWLPINSPTNSRIVHLKHDGGTEIVEPANRAEEARTLLNWNYKLAMEAAQ
jgi:hypothetical protein